MIISGTSLSLSQQRKGQRKYVWFSSLNGVSTICLAENFLVLYVLQMGASDALTGIIGSFLYLGTFFMVAGKGMIQKYGAGSTIYSGWLSRAVFALLLGLAPTISSLFGPSIGLCVATLASFGVFASRGFALVGFQPLIGEITRDGNRESFMGGVFQNFCVGNLVTLGLVVLCFKLTKSATMFQGIVFIGACAGFGASYFIRKVNESDIPRLSAQISLLGSFSSLLSSAKSLKLMCAHSCTQLGLVLTIPYSMMMLRKGYGLENDTALLFALVQMVGGICVSFLCKIISKETGPRPLIIIQYFLIVLVCGMWIFCPDDFNWVYCGMIFFINGICFMGLLLTISQYFLAAVPERERVGLGLATTSLAGLVSGLGGAAIGGGLMELLSTHDLGSLDLFRHYFVIVGILLLVLSVFVLRLERIKDWHIGKVLGLAIAPKDLRALYFLYRFENVSSPEEERENVITTLKHTGSEISEKKLLELLESPKFLVRAPALNALRDLPPTEKVTNALINELKTGEFTTAYLAAQHLANLGVKEAIPHLRKYLHSDDLYLKGKCVWGLATLKDSESYSDIIKIFEQAKNPRTIIHGAVALSLIGTSEALKCLLEKSLDSSIPLQVKNEIYNAIADVLGVGDEFYTFLKMLVKNPERSLELLEKEAASHIPHFDKFLRKHDLSHVDWSSVEEREFLIKLIESEIRKKLNRRHSDILINFVRNNPDASPAIFHLIISASI